MAKPGGLGADREERGDRRRRALVDVGRPHVERRGADLVAEAGQHADDGRRTTTSGTWPCATVSADDLRGASRRGRATA